MFDTTGVETKDSIPEAYLQIPCVFDKRSSVWDDGKHRLQLLRYLRAKERDR